MESKAKILGHPAHPMLVVFPLGLLATAVVFDLIHLGTRNMQWSIAAYYMIAAGVIGALIAAPFGAVDLMAVPRNTRARRIGAVHGAGNAVVVLLFAGSWALRPAATVVPNDLALTLSFAGASLAVVTAWLGGELVSRLGIGVSDTANVNAPSSLEGEPRERRVDTSDPRTFPD